MPLECKGSPWVLTECFHSRRSPSVASSRCSCRKWHPWANWFSYTSCRQIDTPAARHIFTCTVIAQHRRHVFLSPRGPRAQEKWYAKIGHSSTRHVSSCASRYTEHQHKFSPTSPVLLSSTSPNPDLLSTHPLTRRSTAGWHFNGIPLLHGL